MMRVSLLTLSSWSIIGCMLRLAHGFHEDAFEQSVAPEVKVVRSGTSFFGKFQAQLEIGSNDYGVEASSVKVSGSPDIGLIFDRIGGATISTHSGKDYDFTCVKPQENAAETCLAVKRKSGKVLAINRVQGGYHEHSATEMTFDELLGREMEGEPGVRTIYDAQVDGAMTESKLAANAELNTVYTALADNVNQFALAAVKLYAGADLETGSEAMIPQFNRWAMNTNVALARHPKSNFLAHAAKYDDAFDDVECGGRYSNANGGQRPANIAAAQRWCGKNGGSYGRRRRRQARQQRGSSKRRLITQYTKLEIEAFLDDDHHCPLGSEEVKACDNTCFGGCGPGCTEWQFVCSLSEHNDQTYGCANGCFEHDYYCSCIGFFHPECVFPISTFYCDEECHAGSTCVTVQKAQNIRYVNEDMDPWWGWGDPYVWVWPNDPYNYGKWTSYFSDWSGNDIVWGTEQRMCFSMRFDNFHVDLYDDDYDFDDLEWDSGNVNTEPTGQWRTVGSGTGSTPKITFKTQKRGW